MIGIRRQKIMTDEIMEMFIDKMKEFIASYTEKISENPNDLDSYYNRAIAYWNIDEYENSISDYSKAIELDTKQEYITAYLGRGKANRYADHYDEAIADFNTLLAAYPYNYEALYERGRAYQFVDEYDAAIDDFTASLDSKAGDPNVLYYMGTAYEDSGRYEEAIENYNGAIEHSKKDTYAYMHNRRGFCYMQLDMIDEAIADLDKTIEIDPEYAPAYYVRGFIYKNEGEKRRAKRDMKKALELDPDIESEFTIT
jgi:tetratricopeptide (TPR) repeat protein